MFETCKPFLEIWERRWKITDYQELFMFRTTMVLVSFYLYESLCILTVCHTIAVKLWVTICGVPGRLWGRCEVSHNTLLLGVSWRGKECWEISVRVLPSQYKFEMNDSLKHKSIMKYQTSGFTHFQLLQRGIRVMRIMLHIKLDWSKKFLKSTEQ